MQSVHVSEDTQIQVTNVYRRNKTKKDKIKRSFSFVLKGMMLSSVMVSSVIAGFANNIQAEASGNDDTEPVNGGSDTVVQDIQEANYDETARILNLKNANKMLQAAIKSNQLDTWAFNSIMKSLASIEAHLGVTQKFDKSADLLDVMMVSETLLSDNTLQGQTLNDDSQKARYLSLDSIAKIKDTLGAYPTSSSDTVDLDLDTLNDKGSSGGSQSSGAVVSPDKEPTSVTQPAGASTDSTKAVTQKSEPKPQEVKTDTSKNVKQEVKGVSYSKVTYGDFNKNAYWAEDMQWMIDNGFITGYVNQKHPTTGKHGNWLNPSGILTEAQVLSVLLRYDLGVADYTKLREINDPISKQKGFWSYWHYEKAQELGIVTKGSTTNKAYANAQVTRGQLAQAIVSMHYGKKVTVQQAVDFMFANKITTGTKDNAGPTLDNFQPNTKLSRAHISAFLHRYEKAMVSNTLIDTLNSDVKPAPTVIKSVETAKPVETIKPETPKEPDTTVGKSVSTVAELNALTKFKQKTGTADVTGNKIKTKYGERAYGAKTQAEYDAVMAFLNKYSIKDFGSAVGNMDRDALPKEVYDAYKAGKRGTTDKKNTEYYTPLNSAYLALEEVHTLGILPINSYEDVLTYSQISQLAQSLGSLATHNVGLSSDQSGYGALELLRDGGSNCVTWSYAKQAFFDRLGVDSVVVHSPSQMHAYTAIYLNGVWVEFDSALGKLELEKGDYISYAPNGGVDILTKEMQSIYKPVN